MENDSNTIKVKTVTVQGIKFTYTSQPSILKGWQDLSIEDEKGNGRTMIWDPEQETVEQKIEAILVSNRWP